MSPQEVISRQSNTYFVLSLLCRRCHHEDNDDFLYALAIYYISSVNQFDVAIQTNGLKAGKM